MSVPVPSSPEPTPAGHTHTQLHGITRRAFLIGILLIPVMCIWNTYTEVVAQATDLAAMSLPIAVVFTLVVLIVINLALKRYLPRWAFTQAELLYIFIMQFVSIGISGIGMMQFLSTMTANIYYYATPENKWKETIYPHLARWLFPDESVTRGFFVGESSFYRLDVIYGWLAPILSWSAFIFVLLGVMLCINVIVRRQWMDRERLNFPIAALPVELTREGGSVTLFRNRLFWYGMGIPIVVQSLASLNYLYPSIPFLPIKPSDPRLQLGPYFTQPPWNGIGSLDLSFYPLVIGLTYLLSSEVAFSLWFFYLMTKAQDIACVALGFKSPDAGLALQRMPYIGEQAAGAFIGLAIFALYGARRHLSDVLRKAFTRAPDIRDDNEPLSYRTAVIGAGTGMLALTLFGVALGMVWWVPLLLFTLYYLFIITFTRIRAEAGLPWAFGPYMNPHDVMNAGIGTRTFNTPTLTGMATLLWFDLDYRCNAMPNQLDSMKMSEGGRLNNRHLAIAILTATLVGALASWWALLTCYYQYGAATANVNGWRTDMGKVPWQSLMDWINNPQKPDWVRLQGVGVGTVVTAFLMTMRARFTWWPFHPVGYAIAGTFTMPWLWFATFLGWLIKVVVIRYGGMTSYRRFMPFFIGLILGDYIIGSLWAIYGSALSIPTYRAFPI
jgi:hypothetical protein